MARSRSRRVFSPFLIVNLVLALGAWAQQTPPGRSQTSPLQSQAPQTPVARQGQAQLSLGEAARNLREQKRSKVKVTPEEAQQIFQAVDQLLEFASRDSGLARRTKVRRQLVGQKEVEALVREQTMSEEEKQERQRGLLAMKKFGLLPRDFDMEAFAAELMGESIAGFYDAKTKMVSLLNWVPLEEQKVVLAHELTHALQDQNYDLQRWHKLRRTAASDGFKSVVSSETDGGESATAGRSVTEGQAMVVMFDYVLAPMHLDLEHSPGLVEPLQQELSYGPEGPVLHRAPLAIREGMTFPYRAGLMFEIALLEKGSTEMAFSGALQRPPRLTHEVLQPRAYLAREKIAPVRIPDLRPVLGESVRVQDTGVIGEFDTSIFIHQFESKWLSSQLAKAWRGASYVTVARASEGTPSTTNDIALLYVSRWQTPEAATRFAKFYVAAVAKRYGKTAVASEWKETGKSEGVIASAQVTTEEGPVIVELCSGNTVFVTESFDAAASARLREAVLKAAPPAARAANSNSNSNDLTLRLASSPELGPLRQAVRESVMRAVVRAAQKTAGQ